MVQRSTNARRGRCAQEASGWSTRCPDRDRRGPRRDVGIYNRLVTSRNGFKNAFAQIDVQLTRRYDLIPNLVETAKGYLKHERETLEAVIAARNSAVAGLKSAAAGSGQRRRRRAAPGAEAGLSGALGRLFALAEAYPDLKANANMMQLSEELTSTENRVAFSRQAFNDAVDVLQQYARGLPELADRRHVQLRSREDAGRAGAEKREPPKVSFG